MAVQLPSRCKPEQNIASMVVQVIDPNLIYVSPIYFLLEICRL